MRIVRSTMRKLLRRPATYVTLLLLAVFEALIFIAIGASARAGEPETQAAARELFTFPQAYRLVLAFVFTNGLLAAAFGAAIAGSEWTWGTLKTAVARGESRTLYVVGTFVGVAVFLALGSLGAFLVGVPSMLLGAILAGSSLDGATDLSWIGDLPALFGRGILAFAMEGALGFAIATIARSQIAGIGVVIGLNVAESLAGLFARDVFQWFPFSAGNAVVAGGGVSLSVGGQAIGGLDGTTAIVVVGAWLVAALVLAALWTERAEIGG